MLRGSPRGAGSTRRHTALIMNSICSVLTAFVMQSAREDISVRIKNAAVPSDIKGQQH